METRLQCFTRADPLIRRKHPGVEMCWTCWTLQTLRTCHSWGQQADMDAWLLKGKGKTEKRGTYSDPHAACIEYQSEKSVIQLRWEFHPPQASFIMDLMLWWSWWRWWMGGIGWRHFHRCQRPRKDCRVQGMRLRTDDPISFDESIAQLKKLKGIGIVGDKITGDLKCLQTPSWNTVEQKPSALSKFWFWTALDLSSLNSINMLLRL